MVPVRGAAALTTSDLTSLLARHALTPSSHAILGLRGTRRCIALAKLLSETHPNVVPVISPRTADIECYARGALHALPETVFAPPGLTRPESMRFFASEAVRSGARSLVLSATSIDAAGAALGLALGAPGKGKAARPLSIRVGHGSSGVLRATETEVYGCEMLPPGVLEAVRPLIDVPPDVMDATVDAVLGPAGVGAVSEVDQAAALLGDIPLQDAIAMGERRANIADELRGAGDSLLRDAVVEVNHWGFVAVCRETLARAYADVPGGGRELATDVLARLVMHVTGVDKQLSFSTETVQELAEQMLHDASKLPAGRTMGGVLVRPARGPNAESFYRRHQRRKGIDVSNDFGYRAGRKDGVMGERKKYNAGPGRRSGRDGGVRHSDGRGDLIFLSREPDRESSYVKTRRMGGNVSAMPIAIGKNHAVYWDKRYVLSAAPADELKPNMPVISDKAVLLAGLQNTDEAEDEAWTESTFYVRQLRHSDWEYITSSNADLRPRHFKAPYQCIRGLPAIYQKRVGEISHGVLAAVPHLGLSGRPDLVFTAVRLPRFRCIPTDLEPGFGCLPTFPVSDKNEADDSNSGARHMVN